MVSKVSTRGLVKMKFNPRSSSNGYALSGTAKTQSAFLNSSIKQQRFDRLASVRDSSGIETLKRRRNTVVSRRWHSLRRQKPQTVHCQNCHAEIRVFAEAPSCPVTVDSASSSKSTSSSSPHSTRVSEPNRSVAKQSVDSRSSELSGSNAELTDVRLSSRDAVVISRQGSQFRVGVGLKSRGFSNSEVDKIRGSVPSAPETREDRRIDIREAQPQLCNDDDTSRNFTNRTVNSRNETDSTVSSRSRDTSSTYYSDSFSPSTLSEKFIKPRKLPGTYVTTDATTETLQVQISAPWEKKRGWVPQYSYRPAYVGGMEESEQTHRLRLLHQEQTKHNNMHREALHKLNEAHLVGQRVRRRNDAAACRVAFLEEQ